MKLFDDIIQAVSVYNVSVDVKEHELTVINRDNGNELYVFEEEYSSLDEAPSFVRYTVEFSTQHYDIDADDFESVDENSIIEYILAILNDEILPFEFYKDGKSRFGSEIGKDDLDKLSVSYLARQYGYTSDYLMSFDFAIHSWSGKYDTGIRKVSELKS